MTVLATAIEWAGNHGTILWSVSFISLVTFVGTVMTIPFLVARIPRDYFTRPRRHSERRFAAHPRVRILYLTLKNIIGSLFILAGLIMLFIPGQGAITILIGLLLMNLPGKRRLALRMVRLPRVYRALNWMRAKSHRAPLALPEQVRPGTRRG